MIDIVDVPSIIDRGRAGDTGEVSNLCVFMIFGERKQLEEPESRRAEKPKGELALSTEVTGTRKEVDKLAIEEALSLSRDGETQELSTQSSTCAIP